MAKIQEIRIEYLPINDLKPYSKNTRKHYPHDIRQIASSISQYGMADPIGVWSSENIIVEGHGRYMACKMLGMEFVPCIRLDEMSDKERRAYAIAHNKTAELSTWDLDMLTTELAEVDLSVFEFDFSLPNDAVDVEVERKREFEERMKKGDTAEEDEEYREFLEKFELKKTTDDCYTPPPVYDAVVKWCEQQYRIDRKNIIRPFYPGGDYKNEKYKEGDVVLDNPPFSIISEICDFYNDRGIPFFLFAPALTLLGISSGRCKYVAVGASITYENGAVVSTSFVTNLGTTKITASGSLFKAVKSANDENLRARRKELPKYDYPDHVVSSMMLGYIAQYGVNLEIQERDVHFIRALEEQKKQGKGIFGSGFLLSEKAAAEKAAAEKAAAEKAAAEKWSLSEKEMEIIRNLG